MGLSAAVTAGPPGRAGPGRVGPPSPRPASATAPPGRRAPLCVPEGGGRLKPAAWGRTTLPRSSDLPLPPAADLAPEPAVCTPGCRGQAATPRRPPPSARAPGPAARAHPAAASTPVALFPDPSEVTSRRTLPRGRSDSYRTQPTALQKARRPPQAGSDIIGSCSPRSRPHFRRQEQTRM